MKMNYTGYFISYTDVNKLQSFEFSTLEHGTILLGSKSLWFKTLNHIIKTLPSFYKNNAIE